MNIYVKRRLVDGFARAFAVAAAIFGLFWLAVILWTLVKNGVTDLNLILFVQNTPPPGSSGGLANAIFGSILMNGMAILIAAPLGILAGTYLAEYAQNSKLGEAARFINDILLSAPSIIVGMFVYELMVVPMGHFSAWAGTVALAVVALPVIVRTTQDSLSLVSDRLREAASALGSPRWRMIVSISYRSAKNGILTGVLLALARISGETAPLLFTALNNQFWSTNLNAPMANLPVVIFQYALSPYADWQTLAWAGALLITTAVLFINITARLIAVRGHSSKRI